MNAKGLQVTRAVYFGTVGSAHGTEVFDAATDKMVNGITKMEVEVEVAAHTQAVLTFADGSRELVEVHDAPQKPAATSGLHQGTELFGLSIEAYQDPAMNALVFHLHATRFVETGNGVERTKSSARDLSDDTAVSDHALMSAKDPRDIIMHHLRRLGAMLGTKMVEELVQSHPGFANPKPPERERGLLGGVREPMFQAGGVVTHVGTPSGFVPFMPCLPHALPNQDDPAGDVPGDPDYTGAAVCPECKDTGKVELFNSWAPCSRGCKP